MTMHKCVVCTFVAFGGSLFERFEAFISFVAPGVLNYAGYKKRTTIYLCARADRPHASNGEIVYFLYFIRTGLPAWYPGSLKQRGCEAV